MNIYVRYIIAGEHKCVMEHTFLHQRTDHPPEVALQLLTKHANELRKANPKMTLEAARVEARRFHPDVAARERA